MHSVLRKIVSSLSGLFKQRLDYVRNPARIQAPDGKGSGVVASMNLKLPSSACPIKAECLNRSGRLKTVRNTGSHGGQAHWSTHAAI